MVVRPIAAGEQLFDNYGPYYSTSNKKQRQDHLYNQYGFQCTCQACMENFPLGRKLKNKRGLRRVTSGGDHKSKDEAPLEEKLNRATQLANYLQENDHYYPCVQLKDADNELYEIYSSLVEERMWEDKFKDFYRFTGGKQ